MKISSFIITMILSIAFFLLGAVALFDASEVTECKTWATQAGQYSGYYITQWQADQCDAHEIKINAPIK